MAGNKLDREVRNAQTKQRNNARREAKQAKAAEMVAEWRKLTPAQQLADLDRRLGKGVGAKRQRAILAKLM